MNVYLNSENVSRNEENPFHNIQWSTYRQMRKIFAIKLNFFPKRREIKLQSPLSFDINMNFFDKISRTTVTESILPLLAGNSWRNQKNDILIYHTCFFTTADNEFSCLLDSLGVNNPPVKKKNQVTVGNFQFEFEQ